MSKGSKRRPGEGYAEGFDRIFGKTPAPVAYAGVAPLTLDSLKRMLASVVDRDTPLDSRDQVGDRANRRHSKPED